MFFVAPSEVGKLYAREGQQQPVSGKTGFWMFLPLVGYFVWVVKVQGALNRFWASKGADGLARGSSVCGRPGQPPARRTPRPARRPRAASPTPRAAQVPPAARIPPASASHAPASRCRGR